MMGKLQIIGQPGRQCIVIFLPRRGIPPLGQQHRHVAGFRLRQRKLDQAGRQGLFQAPAKISHQQPGNETCQAGRVIPVAEMSLEQGPGERFQAILDQVLPQRRVIKGHALVELSHVTEQIQQQRKRIRRATSGQHRPDFGIDVPLHIVGMQQAGQTRGAVFTGKKAGTVFQVVAQAGMLQPQVLLQH